MPFNGSGTYNRSFSWVNDANNNIDILATRMDTEDNGFATGLSDCVTRDGQSVPTANLPMGTFVHTNVGNATARKNYAAAGQVQDGSLIYGGTSGGTANAQTLSLTPAITAYVAGQTFQFIPGNANTGATTININGVGAVAITKYGTAALAGGELTPGVVTTLKYDGTQFQLQTIFAGYNVAAFTSSGTFTSPTNTLATTVFKITVIGAGAGGGAHASGGGGGGGGGAVVWYATGLAASTGYAVTIGAGSATGASDGGSSLIVIGSTSITAPGGGGGGATNQSSGIGGLNNFLGPSNYSAFQGAPGSGGISSTIGGNGGGGALLGGAGRGAIGANTNGMGGLGYAGGGGGATGSGMAGAGGNGILNIEWIA